MSQQTLFGEEPCTEPRFTDPAPEDVIRELVGYGIPESKSREWSRKQAWAVLKKKRESRQGSRTKSRDAGQPTGDLDTPAAIPAPRHDTGSPPIPVRSAVREELIAMLAEENPPCSDYELGRALNGLAYQLTRSEARALAAWYVDTLSRLNDVPLAGWGTIPASSPESGPWPDRDPYSTEEDDQ